ncbi:MAG TPA: hypothetical protein VJ724_01540 [Tahibacter sp.]|nr:hypothetical protein [Tahibacter sp.]
MTPETARRHFQQLLEAKQARVRQGPSYPAPNDFTGQRDVDAAPADAGTPSPESTYGDPTFAHGRGNQGMRPQK